MATPGNKPAVSIATLIAPVSTAAIPAAAALLTTTNTTSVTSTTFPAVVMSPSVAATTGAAAVPKPFRVRKPVYLPPSNLSERKSRARKRKKFDDEVVQSSVVPPASPTPTPTSGPPVNNQQQEEVIPSPSKISKRFGVEHMVVTSGQSMVTTPAAPTTVGAGESLAQRRPRRLSAGKSSGNQQMAPQAGGGGSDGVTALFRHPKHVVTATATKRPRPIGGGGVAVRPRLPLLRPPSSQRRKGGDRERGAAPKMSHEGAGRSCTSGRPLPSTQPSTTVTTGSSTTGGGQEFDAHTLAVLRGRLVRYLMRSREITLGRNPAAPSNTTDHNNTQPPGAVGAVDVDLSLEGPAMKVSRQQGVIKLAPAQGHFHLVNEGRRPFFVDGAPLLQGDRCRLPHNAVLEIASLRFIFLVNNDLIASIAASHDPTATSAATPD